VVEAGVHRAQALEVRLERAMDGAAWGWAQVPLAAPLGVVRRPERWAEELQQDQ